MIEGKYRGTRWNRYLQNIAVVCEGEYEDRAERKHIMHRG